MKAEQMQFQLGWLRYALTEAIRYTLPTEPQAVLERVAKTQVPQGSRRVIHSGVFPPDLAACIRRAQSVHQSRTCRGAENRSASPASWRGQLQARHSQA